MSTRHRARCALVASILSFAVSIGSAAAAQVDAFFNSGTLSWNVAASWTPAVIPNNGTGGNTYRVLIDNGDAANSVATLTFSPTIDQLTVSAGDTLSFSNGADLAVAIGPIVNNGTISLNSTSASTELIITNSMSLSGPGVLLLSNNAANFIDDADNGAGPLLTHGVDHTIRGSGQFGTNAVALANAGLIDASQSVALVLDLLDAGPNSNTGTIQASGSGTLDITDTPLTNSGIIQALGTSTVNLISSSIIGGTLHADPGSVISPNPGSNRLENITLTGLLRHDNSEDADYAGTIINNGTIALNSTGGVTEIAIPPPSTTFAGTGEIVMTSNAQNLIDDNDAGQNPLLINSATHTIRGAGNIGVDGLHMTNHGLIQADQAVKLTINLTETGPNENTGVMQAVGTSTLELFGVPITNTNGDIKALDSSTVDILSSTIIGGNLHADPGAAISPDNSTFQDITLTGLMRHDNGDNADYSGTIINNGMIALNSTGASTELIIPPPSTTFAGTGEIVMSSSAQNFIDDNDAGQNPLLINSATHTIRGAGNIGVDGLHLTNHGLIQADQAVKLTINLTETGPNENTGVMQAVGTSTLELLGVPITNINGDIKALDTSTVDILSSTIIGGNLHADPGAAISPSNSTLQDITLTGLMRHDNGEDADYVGTITNNGVIALNSTGASTEIAIPNGTTTTISGTGQIILGNNVQNLIDDTDAGPAATLINGPNHTIRGSGNIGTNGLHITNNGTIIADQSVAMTIDARDLDQGFLNNGTVNVTSTGGLTIASGVFTNAGIVNVAATRTLTRIGPYPQTAGSTTVNGTLTVGAGTGLQIQGGTLRGNGVVSGALTTNSGTIAPGDGIGQLGIQNGLSLTASSIVSIEIGGSTPITQHDVLAVTGATSLGGVLQVSFVNGFDPSIGQSFVVMTYPNTPLNTLGKFIDLDVPCDLIGRRIAVDITNTQVIVRIIDAGDLVDVNCDCGYSVVIDVGALMTALLDPTAYDALYPGCTQADVNNDGQRNGKDVQAFVNALLN